jgi:hypothetical protein
METQDIEQSGSASRACRAGRLPKALLATALGLTSLVGCSPTEPLEPQQPGHQSQQLLGDNGLSVNGLSVNGLSVNGLSVNGLSVNGLSSLSFGLWFQKNPPLADEVMRYVVRCALPAGQTLSYLDLLSLKRYTWTGVLGLAPGWASGLPATLAEQQVITACLAAHTNKYQQHVSFSVLGRTADGQRIPFTQAELSEYSQQEGCFFGNLFRDEGFYVGGLRLLDEQESTTRACALSPMTDDGLSNCPPMRHIGKCTERCRLDATQQFYEECTYNGTTYRPLTTRLRPEDVYSCGDGVCQLSESCGTSNQYYNCGLDCGPCP